MSSEGEKRGKKRSKAFYRKSAHGGKRHCTGANVLQPGIKGFLVMCNNNESSAVRESYNILNEYADLVYGSAQVEDKQPSSNTEDLSDEEDHDCDDIEKALKKEVDGLKNTTTQQKRFQNVATKAKNCVFIRTAVEDPVKVVTTVMEDVAQKGLKRARYAARILPIVGTCKAHTTDIETLAKEALKPFFSAENLDAPSSYTIQFKARNNNGNTCGKTSVIPALTKIVSEINPAAKFSWTEFKVAVLVEVVCTVCCLGVAPDFVRLRKYNLQELQQGPKEMPVQKKVDEEVKGEDQKDVTQATDAVTEKNTCSTSSDKFQEKEGSVKKESEPHEKLAEDSYDAIEKEYPVQCTDVSSGSTVEDYQKSEMDSACNVKEDECVDRKNISSHEENIISSSHEERK